MGITSIVNPEDSNGKKLEWHNDWHSSIYIIKKMDRYGHLSTDCDIVFAKLIAHASREKHGKTKTVYRSYYSLISTHVGFNIDKPIITLDLKFKILNHPGSLSLQRYTNLNNAIRDVTNELRKKHNNPEFMMKADELAVNDEINDFINKYSEE